MNFQLKTISAIITPLGEGGVAIVRLSGPEALLIAKKVFSKDPTHFASHTAHVGYVVDREKGQKIDQALCLVMRAPASYTGEDVVEFQCHGGTYCIRRVLELTLCAGAEAAKPGEFTYRAFMNGKMDLAQAESVQALIGAKSESAFMHAQNHLKGRLSERVQCFQKELVEIAAILEAWVDFPEEDLAFTPFSTLANRITKIRAELQRLLDTYEEGERLRRGARIVLVGAPNAGKSSLMNGLLNASRSIVTPIPGTTRDAIESEFILQGRSFSLIDTAGLRTTSCEVEKLGIDRSHEEIASADLVIWVMDATSPLRPLSYSDKWLIVANKVDLVLDPLTLEADVRVSAMTKIGLEELKNKIFEKLHSLYTASSDELVISSHRHRQALVLATSSLDKVIEGLQDNVSAEFITFDIKEALYALGRMIGQDVTEEVLSSIFSQFCIGK